MSYTVSVEGFAPFQVEANTKLVKAIEDNGIDISHRCGGNARCTTCRVRLIGDEPPMGDTEKDCLEEDGVLGQFRLACQIRIGGDVSCEVLMRASEQGWEPGVEVED